MGNTNATIVKALFILLVLGIASSGIYITRIYAESETIFVDDDNVSGPWDGTPEYPYQNISSALLQASFGDTVFVRNGTYFERLVVDKPIALVGESRMGAVIDANKAGHAIEIISSNVSVAQFTIRNSGFFHYQISGIYMHHVENCNISFNMVEWGYKGISCTNVSHSILSENSIHAALECIYLANSSNNKLIGNTIDPLNFNLVLKGSNNNTIFHNNLINANVSSDEYSKNSWDNDNEGNFWGAYAGLDTDQDGIGDTPHVIDTENSDRYPLMGQFSEFKIRYEAATSRIWIISNSTITGYQFNESIRELSFRIVRMEGVAGFCRIMIPKLLINSPHILLIDREMTNMTLLANANETHAYAYFTFNRSNIEVSIRSEELHYLLVKLEDLVAQYRDLSVLFSELDYLYDDLVTLFGNLNSSFIQLNMSYFEKEAQYEGLATAFQNLNDSYNEAKNEYSVLLERSASIEGTNNMLVGFSVFLIAIGVTSSSLFLIYHRRSKMQQRLIQNYSHELERLGLLNTARLLFESDVEKRRGKIAGFQEKYGILIKPHDTLTDALTSLELTKKQKQND